MISTSNFTSVQIESGLDFVLSHLEEPHFPRRISAYLTERNGPWQITVNSTEEALAKFRESNLLNARISAYPHPVPTVRGINAQECNFFMGDLDRKNFKSDKSLEQCLEQTLQNFKDKLHGASPTVLWSGGGYHSLQSLEAGLVLEMESAFADFYEPSMNLMRYLERLVTDNRSDPAHNPSFSNCMLRIPGSYNAKYVKIENDKIIDIPPHSEVKIVQRQSDCRPNIRWFLRDYSMHLIQQRNNEMLALLRSNQKKLRSQWGRGVRTNQYQQTDKIDWIESLYRNPIDEHRRYCIWSIFAPYFINVRRMSQSEASNLIKDWLDRCGFLRRLDFNATALIRDDLKRVGTYDPIGPNKLRGKRPELYTMLENKGIMH